MDPFDLNSAILAKHAQLVPIHFPIALFITSVAFDFAAQGTNKATLAAASYRVIATASLEVAA